MDALGDSFIDRDRNELFGSGVYFANFGFGILDCETIGGSGFVGSTPHSLSVDV
jgi:hypothetical protein